MAILTSVAAISATAAAAMAGSATAMATIAVNVGLVVGVMGSALNIIGRITRDKGLSEVGAQMGMAGGALGLAGGVTNYAMSAGAETAVGEAAKSGGEVVADQTANVATAAPDSADVAASVSEETIKGGMGADPITQPAAQAVDPGNLGGTGLGPQPTPAGTTGQEGLAAPGPAAPQALGGPTPPPTPAPLAAPTDIPTFTPAPPLEGNLLTPSHDPATFANTGGVPVNSPFANQALTAATPVPPGVSLTDWQKWLAMQGVAGLGSGMLQSMTASDKIDLEKRINAQRQAQVEYKNQNAAYAPKVSFGMMGTKR